MGISFEVLQEKYREGVMDVYCYYAENTTYAFPIHVNRNGIFNFFLEIGKKYPVFAVLESETKKVIGVCLLSSYIGVDTFSKTASTTYFIDDSFVGQGIGTMCLNKLESEAKKIGITTLIADISSDNENSIKFHKKHGFEYCGEVKNVGHKFGRAFGIVLMQKEL